eukprot:CAMPEP_0170468350 /NCGR_PEP_ID=MMETSP0123-20130129/11565_1 /TAXON_ID=182087 /ORGANISM="Favella ehrenbergii, Strain Fehren 1" /LENGTH=100 /DNA_ID=CAMNT_0010734901 /DNA_START=229 /DNA_END=531 /DNA_ORIENTATION=-
MIMSQESIWEDTIAPNLSDIVTEITNVANYGTENTVMRDAATEALCRKTLREKLEASFTALLKKMKEVDAQDFIGKANAATKSASIFRTLHERVLILRRL